METGCTYDNVSDWIMCGFLIRYVYYVVMCVMPECTARDVRDIVCCTRGLCFSVASEDTVPVWVLSGCVLCIMAIVKSECDAFIVV